MITLQNVSKVYKTKSKRKVHALNNVSLSFPSKGLCLVSGQSGCGKTTLLNILGGLDKSFEGSYTFLDKQLQTDKDFSDFRRDYASFIFQDFNLIEDFTVAENLAIGFTFTEEDCSSKIAEVLKQVGLEDYESRYPSELSGGEQQRVAVARALLKNSRVLLADEPTGNLDAKNAVEIYELLKSISVDRLVVIVSHDEALGNKYCDYKVQLAKGVLVDSNLPSMEEEPQEQYKEINKRTISNKVAFTMAKHEYAYKKGRSITTTVLLALCFVVMFFAVVLWQYNAGDVVYRLAREQRYEYVNITSNALMSDEYFAWLDGMVDRGMEYFPEYFTSREEAESWGVRLYESDKTMELASNVYYMADCVAENLIQQGALVFLNGEYVYLNPAVHTVTDLIGAGVVDRFDDSGLQYSYIGVRVNQNLSNICGGIFYQRLGEDSVENYKEAYFNYVVTSIDNVNLATSRVILGDKEIYDMQLGGALFNSASASLDFYPTYYKSAVVVISNGGEVQVFDNQFDAGILGGLEENEIYVDLKTYNQFHGTSYKLSNVLDVYKTDADGKYNFSSKIVPELSNSLTLAAKKGKTSARFDNLSVKGVVLFVYIMESGNEGRFSYWDADRSPMARVYTNNVSLLTQFKPLDRSADIWVKTSSIPHRSHFFHVSGDMSIYRFDSPYTSEKAVVVESRLDGMQLVMLLVSALLLVATCLVLGLTISSQIKGRVCEIGIFKALGARNGEIVRIYLFELLFIVVPLCIACILLTVVLVLICNAVFAAQILMPLKILGYKWYNVFLSVGVVSLVTFISVIAPLSKINKTNVIEAIRNS